MQRYTPNSKWGSSVNVDMKSLQFVSLFGFLFTVVDFITAPFEEKEDSTPPALPDPSSHAPSPPPEPKTPAGSTNVLVCFLTIY